MGKGGVSRYWRVRWRVKLLVSTQLQDLLKASGLNQGQLAEALGVKPPMVSRLLNGQGNATLETLVKVGRVLGYAPRVAFVPLAALNKTKAGDVEPPAVSVDIEPSRPVNVRTVAAVKAAKAGPSSAVSLEDL
jgi:transcriptional regulator with XRE-family HTH domain